LKEFFQNPEPEPKVQPSVFLPGYPTAQLKFTTRTRILTDGKVCPIARQICGSACAWSIDGACVIMFLSRTLNEINAMI